MSYQTVTDIITGSQNDISYQVKDLMKNNSSSSSTSFNDLVSYYKKDSKIENVNSTENSTYDSDKKIEDKPVESQDNPKEVNKEEEVDKTSENSKVESSEKSDESKKSKEISKFDKKKDKEIKKESQHLFTSDVESKNEEEKDNKIENKKDSKKLSNKEFSRMHEISEKAENTKSVSINDDSHDYKKLLKEINKEESENAVDTNNKVSNDLNIIQNTEYNSDSSSSNTEKRENKDSNLISLETKKSTKTYLDKDQKIEVQDFRSIEDKIDTAMNENKSKLKVSEPKLVNEHTATMTMELNQNANANVLSTNSQIASSNGSNFQAMLNNQIQQSAPEFVKAGNLILKDNNQGTINLVLRPDDLGNVKLHLSLDGKNITGHITVATKEALEVFKDNAETLREAFIKGGFDNASFDVSFSGNGSSNQQMNFNEQNDGTQFIAKRVYNNNVTESVVNSSDISSEKTNINGDYSINIVA